MQVSNSVLPPDALAGVRMSSSKSTNRIEKPASSSTSGETFVPQFVYTPQLGWTPVNPHALMQLQAQGGYLQHLAESAMQGVAQVRYPFPTSHTIQDDLYTAAHQHAQAMHIAEVQQPVPPQQLKPTVSVSEPSGHSKSAAKPASGRKDPFVYVNPSEQVLLEIRRRALFVAPMYRPRQRVAQACEACRKRKIKCTGTKPKCKRCINRSIDCVYAPENRGTKVSKTERSLPLVSLQNLKLQEDHGDSMDASPTDNSVLAPNSGAAIGPLSLEISPPYYPQFLATRSLSAPAQGPTHMVDYAAVRQDHRAHAQGFSLPGPSQPPASYFYSHASSLQPPAYAAQQAEYTGLPSPQNSSPYYNYLQPPVMQQRSQSHPAHYTASGHYSQNPAHIHTRSYTDSQETTSQPPRPVVSITRPPVQSTGLEQRLNALSIETGPGHYSTTPPLTRAQSAVSSYVGTPMGEPIQMEYFARMPPAGYKTCGAGATAVLDMMQMARTQSVASTASGYSDPGSPPDEGNMPAGGVSPHEQICDFSEFFEGFSVSE